MATKSSTLEVPLSVSDCFALVQNLGAEMGYAIEETKENEFVRWKVKTKRNYSACFAKNQHI